MASEFEGRLSSVNAQVGQIGLKSAVCQVGSVDWTLESARAYRNIHTIRMMMMNHLMNSAQSNSRRRRFELILSCG